MTSGPVWVKNALSIYLAIHLCALTYSAYRALSIQSSFRPWNTLCSGRFLVNVLHQIGSKEDGMPIATDKAQSATDF
jgi:hypothetical protein